MKTVQCDCVDKIKNDMIKKYTVNGIEPRVGVWGLNCLCGHVWLEIWDVFLNRYKKTKTIEVDHSFCPFCGMEYKTEDTCLDDSEKKIAEVIKHSSEEIELLMVKNMDIPTMARNALLRAQKYTLQSVADMDETEVCRIRQLGKLGRYQVYERLTRAGFQPKWKTIFD